MQLSRPQPPDSALGRRASAEAIDVPEDSILENRRRLDRRQDTQVETGVANVAVDDPDGTIVDG